MNPFLPDGSNPWRCPADLSTVRRYSQTQPKGVNVPRVRSYSMSGAFGSASWLPAERYRTFARSEDIRKPAKTFVFVDEHPDSLNDAVLSFQGVSPEALSGNIIDFPASFHDNGASFSFADGHSEVHIWKGTTIRPRVSYGKRLLALNVPARDSLEDVKWLSANGSERRDQP